MSPLVTYYDSDVQDIPKKPGVYLFYLNAINRRAIGLLGNGPFEPSKLDEARSNLKRRIKSIAKLLSSIGLEGWQDIADAVNQRLFHLNEVITEFVPAKKSSDAIKKVKTIFSDLVTRPVELKNVEFLHDLASKDCIQLENWIGEALTHIQAQTKVIHLQLNKLDEELSNVSLQIERAPDQESLKSDLDAIKVKNEEIVQLSIERNTHLELARRYTWQAIDLVRKMRKLEEQFVSGESKGISYDETAGASEIREGYFWKAALDKEEVLANAA